MNKIFKHKRGASGLKVVCEFTKSHCSSGEKTAVNSGAHVSTRSGFKSLSIALISALTLGIATPAMAVNGEYSYLPGSQAKGTNALAIGVNAKAKDYEKNTAYGSDAEASGGGWNLAIGSNAHAIANGYLNRGNAIAIGSDTQATGQRAMAIGANAEATQGQGVAIGSGTKSIGAQSTAIGNDVVATGMSAIAIGNDDIWNGGATDSNNKLLGYERQVFTDEELKDPKIVEALDAMCRKEDCPNSFGLRKVGNHYEKTGVNFMHWSPTLSAGLGSIVIGSRSVAVGKGSTAIGTLTVATGDESTAIGTLSKATASKAIAIGRDSIANMENSVALGVSSKTDYAGIKTKAYVPSLGYVMPMANSVGVISVGSSNQQRRIVNLAPGALDTDAVNVSQLKSLAESLGMDGINDSADKMMRYLSVEKATGEAGTVQKPLAKEKAFKTYAELRKMKDMMALNEKATGGTYDQSEKDKISSQIADLEGKYDGFKTAITATATTAEINSISANSSEAEVKALTNKINAYTDTNPFALTQDQKNVLKNANATNEGATGADAIAIGYSAKSTGAQAVSLGKTATASGASAIAIGNGAKADGGSSINIGSGVRASLGGNVTLIGNNNTAGENSSASLSNTSIIGSGNKIDGGTIDHNLIIGTRHEINQDKDSKNTKLSQNVIIGDHINFKNSEEVISIGSDTDVINSQGGITIGGDSNVLGGYERTGIKGKGAIAIGAGAQVGENFNQNTGGFAEAGVSLGVKSKTTVAQGVALGSESVADRVSIVNKTDAYNGSDEKVAGTIKGNYGAVSVGNSNATRQIINVAAGSNDTDAVNVAQLKSIGFNVKGKNSAGTDDVTNSIKSGKTVEFASGNDYLKIDHTTTTNGNSKFTFNVNEEALKSVINQTSKGVTADALQGKLEAGTNIKDIVKDGDKVKINAKGTTVVAGNGITVDEAAAGENKTAYTVGLNDVTIKKIDKIDNLENKAMQNLQVIANSKDDQIATISKDDKLNFTAGNNLVATLDKNGKTVTYAMKDGVEFNNITAGKNGTNGTDGKITVNGKDGSSVVINGEDGSIGLTGKPGVDGTSPKADIKVAKGEDGTTRIIYETPKKGGAQGVDKHEVATLDDGIKFVGNNGDKALKLNKQFTIQGAKENKDAGTATTVWDTFDAGANIMTKAEADGDNGKLTIALAKALTGLTSAEFKNAAGDKTVINGNGVEITPSDTSKAHVVLNKDGLNNGGNKITNIADGSADGDAVSMKQFNELANKGVTADALQGKLEAGTNIKDIVKDGDKVKINAKGTTVVAGNGITVDEAAAGENKTAYTVGLNDVTIKKIDKIDNLENKAMQNLQVIANSKDDQIATISKDDKLNFTAGNNLVATLDKNGKTVTYAMKDGVEFNNITAGKNGTNGTDGKITVNGKDGSSVVINGEDGSIGLTGKPGVDGTSPKADIKVAKGEDGTTRIIYETPKKGGAQGVDKHEVATLDDGIKFVGNNGDKALKLNKQFTIQGAKENKDAGTATTVWDTFDAGANIMTKAEADGDNGKLTIALAKALTGLTSAEFKNAAGDKTVINGNGIKYNPKDNTDPNKEVSLGKDGINAGGKTISNVATGVNEGDAVNKKQMDEAINKAVAASNTNTTALTFVGDNGNTKAKDGEIKIVGGQTETSKLSDKPNIGVVAKDGKLDIKLAKDIAVDSVTAKNSITVGEGANKITIADGKISGITSAVDPKGELAKELKAIDNKAGKSDAEKAAAKKDAIQKALENVSNGNVATVGDLKNVTNGLDSVVTNITNNVNNITNNVTNITNITSMVANQGDKQNIDKAAEASKKYQSATTDEEKQKIAEEAKEVVKNNKIKTYNPYETTVKNNTTIVEAIQNMNERGIKFIHVSAENNLGKDDNFAFDSEDSRANMKGSIGIGMSAASTAENAIATGTNSKASGENSIATGTDSQASGLNSIAMGNGAQAIGKNTISIGTGNKVTGINSGAIGDPTTLDNVNGVYSMGNDNFIQGGGKGKDNIKDPTARDIFAIGNNIGSDTKKVTDAANYSVILGSKGYSDVEKGVALGYGSNADRKALTTDKEKASAYNGENNADVRGTIRGDYGAVSVGNKDATRQIINVAAGRDDSDAVNVAQLKAATSQIMASTNGISMNGVTIDPNTGKQVNINKGNISKYAPEAKNINSVAIGANSVANRANTVSVGSAGNERIIANVADGVAPTDAANMRQLQSVANMVGEVKKDAMAGTASAMAIGNLPQATIPGKGMMAIGAGYYKGQTATALGVSKMSENGKWVFKASASYDSQRNVGAAGAIGFHF